MYLSELSKFEIGIFIGKLPVNLTCLFLKVNLITMMHQEMCTMTWQTYSNHLKDMMKELMMNDDFADVTL